MYAMQRCPMPTPEIRKVPPELLAKAREAMAADDSAARMRSGTTQKKITLEYACELWDEVGRQLQDFINGYGQKPENAKRSTGE